MEVAVLMFYQFYCAVHGNPVGMHVEQTHEDTHHDSPVVEVFVLLHFLYHHHSPVGRCYNKMVRVSIIDSDGTAEEVYHDKIYCRAEGQKNIEWDT